LNEDFAQTSSSRSLRTAWRELLRLAVAEDLGAEGDWTTRALVPQNAEGSAAVVARQPGVVAGLALVEMTLAEIEPRLRWAPEARDGDPVAAGKCVGRIAGPARGILTAERLTLNLLARLSGIATLTRRYVDAVDATEARIYDTRKTTPGWRLVEKYAVRCGGGSNHRTGLFDAVLIKDNHLAFGAETAAGRYTPAEAVGRARRFAAERGRGEIVVEIEVDTLEQLDAVMPAGPDLVLLDNMSLPALRQAVARRNAVNPTIILEASGGVNLQMVRSIAETGVDRISVGALTHSAVALDLGLDWD